jgi:hypothetical protein
MPVVLLVVVPYWICEENTSFLAAYLIILPCAMPLADTKSSSLLSPLVQAPLSFNVFIVYSPNIMKAVLVAAQVLAILSYCHASPIAQANELG